MRFLAPLGLIGLLGVVALIIIYIIKPNFQQKFISSTYVWKLSLKYKKKRIPTSKLRNILIIICQVLILVLCAMILAQPNKILKQQKDNLEIVAIIDSSASMRAGDEDGTRFERAVEGVKELAESTFKNNGVFSCIIADEEPTFLFESISSEGKDEALKNLTALTDREREETEEISFAEGDIQCSYGVADINSAVLLCDEILAINPSTQIYLFTDNTYSYVPSTITVKNVAENDEWNAGILDVKSEIEDNYYKFTVQLASYHKDTEISLNMAIYNAGVMGSSSKIDEVSASAMVNCSDDAVQTVVFRYLLDGDDDSEYDEVENFTFCDIDGIYSYESVYIYIDAIDNYEADNSYFLYGGDKELIKVQYASTMANSFVSGFFNVLRSNYADRFDIDFTDVKRVKEGKEQMYETEGYDLYVFEHETPTVMPKDGVVLLLDPDSAPVGAGFTVGSELDYRTQMSLFEETQHSVLNGVNPEDITISKITQINGISAGYDVILSCNGSPALFMKNDGTEKVAVMAFSVHFSNASITPDFVLLFKNIFNEYFPSIILGDSFEIGDKITVNSRGDSMEVTSSLLNKKIEDFPATMVLNTPGKYTFYQISCFGKEITKGIYVKAPASESNIWNQEDSIVNPYKEQNKEDYYQDLMFFFAIALVAFLFMESFLQAREAGG